MRKMHKQPGKHAARIRRSIAGFTLIELMVAVAIVGVLTAIAYPSYIQHTRRSNRTDATRAMTVTSQALERCYSQTFTYVGCANVPTVAAPSANGYYSMVVSIPSASQYTITATPAREPQLSDTKCVSFVLQSSGVQSATNAAGTSTTAECWGSN